MHVSAAELALFNLRSHGRCAYNALHSRYAVEERLFDHFLTQLLRCSEWKSVQVEDEFLLGLTEPGFSGMEEINDATLIDGNLQDLIAKADAELAQAKGAAKPKKASKRYAQDLPVAPACRPLHPAPAHALVTSHRRSPRNRPRVQ